jgi:hypothetical protein
MMAPIISLTAAYFAVAAISVALYVPRFVI